MLPEQAVIRWLYRQIDEANEQLHELRVNYRVVRLVGVEYIEPAAEDGSVQGENPGQALPVHSGNICRECGGEMIRTGSCETCRNCGETSGGCS